MLKDVKVGCVGCGVMGSALIKGVAKALKRGNLFLYDREPRNAKILVKETGGIVVNTSNEITAQNCDFIFLAVKPYVIKNAVEELFDANTSKRFTGTIVSVAAGQSIEAITSFLPENMQNNDVGVIRLMPNTPCLVGEGMIGLSALKSVKKDIIVSLCTILAKAGIVEQVPETLLDAVTAISGSGPAYAFIFIEALADAAVQFGMPRKQAYVYAAQMLKGAASMVLETGTHPAVLKDGVCSPGGITIAAVETLEANGFRAAVIAGAKTAWTTSIAMGKK